MSMDQAATIDAGPVAHGGMEYGDWVTNFWWPAAVSSLSENTRGNYRTTLNRYVIPFFETEHLNAISKTATRAWVQQLHEAGHKSSTIDSAIRVFRTTMMAAMAKGLIEANPLVGLKAP